MSKLIKKAEETRQIAGETVNEIANVVAQTLGPRGNPIIIQQDGNEMDGTPKRPHVTKDGVTVAKSISYGDPAKDTISRTIIEASSNTVNQAGDGTTTTMVLLQSIFNEGSRLVEQGNNGIELFQDLKKVSEFVMEEIDKVKKPIDLSKVRSVALISANGDDEVADVVTEAVTKIGEDGYIKIEDGYGPTSELEIKEGANYSKGWRSFGSQGMLLVTDRARNLCSLQDAAVFVYCGELSDPTDVDHIVKTVNKDERNPLFIVAHNYSDDALSRILEYRTQGRLQLGAIKSIFDGSPNARTDIMHDLAVMTGATVAGKGMLEVKEMTEEHLGYAPKIEIYPYDTIVYLDEEDEEMVADVEDRISELKTLLEHTPHGFDQDNLRIRIAKLAGGVGVIRVGGYSDTEIAEKKDRVEDALCSSRAAIKDGIVEGGGFTLYRIAEKIKENNLAERIMKNALQAPVKRIIENAGKNPDVILSHLPKKKGYDAKGDKYVDLMKAGIIDAAMVTKNAVRNSVSVAGILLTTGGSIVNDSGSQGMGQGNSNPLAALNGLFGQQ